MSTDRPFRAGYRFLHGGKFLEYVARYRNIWLAGSLGSGKTLLSVVLGLEFRRLRIVDYFWSNFPVRVDLLPPPSSGLLWRTMVVFDEAHETVNARDFQTNAREYGSYARKIDSVWLYPSVDTIDKRLRVIKCQRAFRLDVLPVNAWVYRWNLMLGDEQEGGWFLLINPEVCFGLYDHRFIPADDGGILEAWQETRKDAERRQGGGGWRPFKPGEWSGGDNGTARA